MRPCAEASTWHRRDALKLGSAFIVGQMVVPRSSLAQSKYPERPIKLVVPFGPGGLADVVGRLWADKLKASLGPVFIENQGGAGGSIGRAAVLRADPDGHTLLLGGAIQIINRIVEGHEPHDPAKELEPVSILVVAALAIVTHPKLDALLPSVALERMTIERLMPAQAAAAAAVPRSAAESPGTSAVGWRPRPFGRRHSDRG